jgi:hypothetical protein
MQSVDIHHRKLESLKQFNLVQLKVCFGNINLNIIQFGAKITYFDSRHGQDIFFSELLAFGLFLSSGILETRKHNVSETGSVFFHR